MEPAPPTIIPIRHTAKGLLLCGGGVVFVANKEGMLNLPGGGIDEDETPIQAVRREIDEEVDLGNGWLGDLHRMPAVEGITVARSGEVRLARWHLFLGRIVGSAELLQVGTCPDIHDIAVIAPTASLRMPQVRDMAKLAVAEVLRSFSGPRAMRPMTD